MAFLDETFDINELPAQSGHYGLVPAGWYQATIAGAELKNTKAGNGKYIAIRYDITGPSYQGKTLFANVNIKNPNPKAEEIGRQQLGEIMRSIGLSKVTDTDQLIGGILAIKVTIRPESGEYPEQNEVKGFKSLVGSSVEFQSSKSEFKQDQAKEPAKDAPPWAKR